MGKSESKGATPQPSPAHRKTMLELLFQKRSAVLAMRDKGLQVNAALEEVDRQIKQISAASGGNPISGKGITKSGPED